MIDVKIPAAGQKVMPALAALAIAWLTACTSAPGADTTAAEGQTPSQEDLALAHGQRLYKVSCSGCHGAHAHGDGPIAPLLNVPVPDLTLIASRRGGSFPVNEVYQIIDGQADLPGHGPRHMPVWGYEFFGDSPDDELAHGEAIEKIERLLSFLQSIQRTP